MKISPIDIRHKQFGRGLWGLNEEEVIEFIQQVAHEMESLILERNSLRDSIREKDLALTDMRERDRVLQSTIHTAGQMSEKIRADAEREAKLVVADAQQKAEIITRDSRDSLKKIYQEISDLKRTRLQFEANLKALAQAHLTLLEQGERLMPNFALTQSSEPANKSNDLSPLSASGA
ncbi:MAG: cell division protein DivIVA [Bdellovibrio sp.]|nr:MAG: cell division protein DivIVA [Bdellovibrio sp.]